MVHRQSDEGGMKTLRIEKGRNKLLLDRNRDAAFLKLGFDGAGLCMFLDADELAELGSWATAFSRALKREKAYSIARIETRSAETTQIGSARRVRAG